MKIQLNAPSNGLIGHRGLAGLAPENTLESFVLAKQNGLEWIEFDIQLSKDHELIIFHDFTLNRTTNGQGLLYEQSYPELSILDSGSWFDKQYSGCKILNLEKDLSRIKSLGLSLNIEVKCPPSANQTYIDIISEKLVKLVGSRWYDFESPVLISSFNWDVLARIRRSLPTQPLGFLCESLSADALRIAAEDTYATINCDYNYLTDIQIHSVNALNIPLLVYTVNNQDAANMLLDQGVFAVFTDLLTDTVSTARKVV